MGRGTAGEVKNSSPDSATSLRGLCALGKLVVTSRKWWRLVSEDARRRYPARHWEKNVKRAIVFACMAVLSMSVFAAPPKPGYFEPRKGDVGILHIAHLEPNALDSYRKIITEKILPAAAADSLVRDVYWMVSEDKNETITLMLNSPEVGEITALAPVVWDLAKGLIKDQRYEYCRVLDAFNEGFYPQPGDKAVLITRQIKEGMFEEAKAFLVNSMIAALAADAYNRYYVVLEQKRTNTLYAFSFIRGEVVSDPKVVAIREVGFNRFMAKPFAMKTYSFFAVNDE